MEKSRKIQHDQCLWEHGLVFTWDFIGKPHDLHGKIDGFRLRLSQKKQSIDYGNKDCQNMGIYQVCSPMFSAATWSCSLLWGSKVTSSLRVNTWHPQVTKCRTFSERQTTKENNSSKRQTVGCIFNPMRQILNSNWGTVVNQMALQMRWSFLPMQRTSWYQACYLTNVHFRWLDIPLFLLKCPFFLASAPVFHFCCFTHVGWTSTPMSAD